MPPKPKKIKVTKDKSTKAIAKTKKGSAQAQTTKVVVKIGETKKPAPRRRRATGKKSPPGGGGGLPPRGPPPTDGWYPPQNLMRNGATFAGTEQIRYVNVPTPGTSSFVAGGAVAPPTLVPPTPAPMAPMMQPQSQPDMQSGFDAAFADDTSSVAPSEDFFFSAPYQPPLVPSSEPEPTFVEVENISRRQKPKTIQFVKNNITDALAELGRSRDDDFKQQVARDALGPDYVQGRAPTKYTKLEDVERILARLKMLISQKDTRQPQEEMSYAMSSSR